MSANLTPAVHSGTPTALAPAPQATFAPAAFRDPDAAGGGADLGQLVSRTIGALGRFKWLILAFLLAGAGVGAVLVRLTTPEYQVASTILVNGTPGRGNTGPVGQDQMLERQGWIDLMRSFAIADTVVMKLALYLEPANAADTVAFRGFMLHPKGFRPGEYELEVTGARYTLRDDLGLVSEEGVVGDSVGRTAGFLWRPTPAALGKDRTMEFTVRTPREASVDVIKRMWVDLREGSTLLYFGIQGTAQQKPSETLNAWGEQFVSLATGLKTARTTQYTKILAAQLADADQRLRAAERAYQQFRVAAITLPSEGVTTRPPAQTGGEMSFNRDPAIDRYFEQKYSLGNVQRDRQALERLQAQLNPTTTPVEALLGVPTVMQDPAAVTLRASLQEIVGRQGELRTLRQTMTDSMPAVKSKADALRNLQGNVIPQQLATVLGELRKREGELGRFVGQASGELQSIPQRTTQQEALRRDMESAAQLYTSLQQRFAEAELAEKSFSPDVRVLDPAVMPLEPSANTAPRLFAMALGAGLALGLGLAVLLDRMDRRFRYPSQVSGNLQLQILGVVPQVQQDRKQSPERVAQIVEAFRTIRMNVRYACMPTPRVALTITSPGAGDGKSLVASNLALSFAEGGWRTVLIDGDLRRGALHTTFQATQVPGLVEYLEGTSLLGEIVQGTSHDNLALITSGTRHRRAPELLATPRMQQLVAALSAEYDAIIIDTPPFGAGTDAYAIGTVTQNMLVVMRAGTTDLKMAKAKLDVVDQLPIQVIGAVLNEIDSDTASYQYFAYDTDYAALDEPAEPAGRIGAGA